MNVAAATTGRARQAAVTFDLDGLARDPFRREPSASERARLHGLAFDVVLPRIIEWLEAARVKATFFAIGADVERFPDAMAALVRHGHEVASHTFSHPRKFSQLDAAAVRADLERAHDVISSATGVPPRGFRAPGYTISAEAIRILTDLGYAYDASVVPSWSYSLLKHAFRVLGRREFRDYLVPQQYACAGAPRLPYRIDPRQLFAPSRDAALVEIPVTTIGAVQVPFIHGLLARLPSTAQAGIDRMVRRRPFFSLAFHDLEFADRADYGGLPASGLTEQHLTVPIVQRLAQLTARLDRFRQTHSFLTLRDIAAATSAVEPAAV